MNAEKCIVTLIGVRQAQAGRVFIHKGAGSKCGSCEYYQVCVGSVKPDRVYRIIKTRDKTLLCRQYETEMRVIEVAEAAIPAVISTKKAIGRAVITFQTLSCEIRDCESCELCFPAGLSDGDRCQVLEVTQKIPCSSGFSLTKVLLQRVPSS